MIPFHRIARMLYNRPLLITPQAAETISAYFLSRVEMRSGSFGMGDEPIEQAVKFSPITRKDGSVEMHSARASRFVGDFRSDSEGRPSPYPVTEDGVAMISLIGEFVNRGAWMNSYSGMISYEGFTHELQMCSADPDVKAIVLDMESPGGEAIGAMEAAAVVRQCAAVKPVIAFGNGLVASAAYAIASGATARVGIPSSQWGSIGVVLIHMDASQMLQKEGIKPTLIFAGAHKVDGNPYEPLPKDVRARFEDEVNKTYDSFVKTVATGTGLSEDAIRATEAQLYPADEAKALGLIDEIGTLDDVLGMIQEATKEVRGTTPYEDQTDRWVNHEDRKIAP